MYNSYEKAQICCSNRACLHKTETTKKFGLHRTTVLHIIKQYTQTEAYYDVDQKPGWPCKFTPHAIHVAVCALAHIVAHDNVDLQNKYFSDINTQTILTRLQTYSLHAYIHYIMPLLTAAHKEKQFEWAKAHTDY